MRDFAILVFLTVDGVMREPTSSDEDRSGGLMYGPSTR